MKNKYLSTLLLFLLCACSSNNEDANKEAKLGEALDTAIEEGVVEIIKCPAVSTYSSISTESEEIISDPNNFMHVYSISDLNSNEPPPDINFAEKVVVAIHLGEKESSGHHIDFEKFEIKDSLLNITYVSISPPNGCQVELNTPNPYCLIAVDNSFSDITFTKTEMEICFN
ncbi:hypothetical protein C2869_04005 [Saccharobesus litoralis]|uniref:Uncharacterized protein n=1 Tax=Saccharobesus litoralis TaxID=2172099 RepID=A0A2S0VNJ6_9ALTE|nr:protease complex subunit PrcB family protein [Saccharobesus litoralis]AWB65650.1 hypothetical protein C2869_04005 [Saccharobesus litoralis]